jgi:hypothetical protein
MTEPIWSRVHSAVIMLGTGIWQSRFGVGYLHSAVSMLSVHRYGRVDLGLGTFCYEYAVYMAESICFKAVGMASITVGMAGPTHVAFGWDTSPGNGVGGQIYAPFTRGDSFFSEC